MFGCYCGFVFPSFFFYSGFPSFFFPFFFLIQRSYGFIIEEMNDGFDWIRLDGNNSWEIRVFRGKHGWCFFRGGGRAVRWNYS